MPRERRRKCSHCGKLYQPNPRSRYHQRYCGEAACQKASKAASQAAWRASPDGRDYFKGEINRARVKAWRKAHPGYGRNRDCKRRALQDDCAAQVLVSANDKRILSRRALQDLLVAQHLAITGLIAHLTDSTLQENIASNLQRMVILGQQIRGSDGG